MTPTINTLLARPPSVDTWNSLISAVDSLPSATLHDSKVQQDLEASLDSWPDELRVGPRHWLLSDPEVWSPLHLVRRFNEILIADEIEYDENGGCTFLLGFFPDGRTIRMATFFQGRYGDAIQRILRVFTKDYTDCAGEYVLSAGRLQATYHRSMTRFSPYSYRYVGQWSKSGLRARLAQPDGSSYPDRRYVWKEDAIRFLADHESYG